VAAAAGALLLAVTATAGCSRHHDKAAAPECSYFYKGPLGRPGPLGARPLGSDPVGFGEAAEVPTLERNGTMTAAVTGVEDPVPGGKPRKGCRWVGIDVQLRDPGTTAASVDLDRLAFLISDTGTVYGQIAQGPSGRDGVSQADLVGGDERRGTLIYQVPARVKIRYFAVAQDKVADNGRLHNASMVLDLTKTSSPGPPLVAYRPGDWPGVGTTQRLSRPTGEQLDATPTRVMDPVVGGKGVRAGYRLYSVQLRVQAVGAKPWQVNPDNMATLIDDSGRQWYTTFATTPGTVPEFDNFNAAPSATNTGWVTFEIPDAAHAVGLMLSSYYARTWAWRL
jgi:hypothetical protein